MDARRTLIAQIDGRRVKLRATTGCVWPMRCVRSIACAEELGAGAFELRIVEEALFTLEFDNGRVRCARGRGDRGNG